MNGLTSIMSSLNGSSAILLAVFIGLFGEVDMGGPITKSVSMFTLALMNEGIYEPNGMFRIAVAIPPIGIFLATLFFKRNLLKVIGMRRLLLESWDVLELLKEPFPS